jgi:RNA-directed DNA polymerase
VPRGGAAGFSIGATERPAVAVGSQQARNLNASLEQRFAECGLTLHPEKTKIVYCKDDDRRGTYRDQALKKIRQTVRGWALHERSDKSLDDLARMFNANIRGWINYCGWYYKSALYPTLRHIDRILARWAHRKFKSLQRHRRRSQQWLERIARRQPDLFAHWCLLQGRGRTMGAG